MSRTRLVMILVAALLATGIIACDEKTDLSHVYVSKTKKFKITFPPGWEIKENELGMDVIGLAPLTGANDEFRDNVYVATSPMEKPLDPDGVLDSIVPSMINTITDFEVQARGHKKIGDADSAFLTYDSRQGKFHLTGAVHALVKNQRAYLVYTIVETKYAPLFKPNFDQVVQSFEALP